MKTFLKRMKIVFLTAVFLGGLSACGWFRGETYNLALKDYDGTILYEARFEAESDLSELAVPEAFKSAYGFIDWRLLIPTTMPKQDLVFTMPSIDQLAQDQYREYFDANNPVVLLDIAGRGMIVIELFPSIAPNTVHNFIHLVEQGYYDGVEFHRIIRDVMIQGGKGAPLLCRIEGQFSENDYDNPLSHTRGVISMVRLNEPDSATSQFFIVHQGSTHLDGYYASFGALRSGFNVLDAIAVSTTDDADRPISSVTITRAVVDTKGVTYPAPQCVEAD